MMKPLPKGQENIVVTPADLIHTAYRNAVVISQQNRAIAACPSAWRASGWPALARQTRDTHLRACAEAANAIPKLASDRPLRAVRKAVRNLVVAIVALEAWVPPDGTERLCELRVAARVRLIELDELLLADHADGLSRLLAVACRAAAAGVLPEES